MHTGVLESYAFKLVLEWLGFTVRWECCTDSSACRAMAYRSGVGRVRHMDLRLLWTQHATRKLGLHVRKVDGASNRADLGTKKHSRADHERLVNMNDLVAMRDYRAPLPVHVNKLAKID